MKRFFLSLIVISFLSSISLAQNPAPGPYYFVSDNVPGPEQFYWGGTSNYGGIRVIENYNLLASVLGDDPSSLVSNGQQLVAEESFDFGAGSVKLQPFVFTEGSRRKNLPIGPGLNAFLRDPLGGAKFDLTLPFSDPSVALSDRSALLRVVSTNTSGTWHTAVDLDFSGNTTQDFEVTAPADGIVEGNNISGSSLCLKHKAPNGREFLTIYQHMVPGSKSHLTEGGPVLRGQVIGRVQVVDGYAHLHFGVAVRGPSRAVSGTIVPELWYLIDPFGVYDYRRNRNNQANYNYLPNDTMAKNVRGIHKAYVWRTNPPIGSLLLKEDCIAFNPETLSIEALSNGRYRLNSGSLNLFVFPNMLEAGNALSVIRKYGYTKACFIGRPQPSLEYLR